jgi:hypothetical protein
MKYSFLSMQIIYPKTKLKMKTFQMKLSVKDISLFCLLSLLINKSLQISARTIFQNDVNTKITVNKRINIAHDVWRV